MYGDYEKIGKQTYLRLVAGEGEVRDDFACRMISEVEIPGLIRLYYAPADGHDIYLDSDRLVGGLAGGMSRELAKKARRNVR